MSFLDLLDRPIAFHRIFVKMTGSVTAALMLSQAFYWSKRTSDPDGWFYKVQAEWEDETGMSRYEQEGARKNLRSKSFWQEKRVGLPAKLFYRIDLPELEKCLTNLISEKPQACMGQSTTPVCGKVPIKSDEKPQSFNIQRILTENTAETTHTYDAQSQNPESVCDKKNAPDTWQDPEPPKPRPTPINQTTVNQAPTNLSAVPDQGSAPRERESFSKPVERPRVGATSTRRLSNWEKPQGEWWGRWRIGQGPGQWNEGFVNWMTHNWIQGKKRDRCAVIGYLVNCEADRTGAALQKLEAFFDSYESSWEAQTGHSADDKWLALASKLYENSQEMEQCNAA